MDDIKQKYIDTLNEYDAEIKKTDKKAQKAMRVTLWLKIIVAFISVGAIASWLKDHGHKEIWALLLIFGQLAIL